MSKDYQKNLDGLKTSFSLARDEYVASYPNAKLYPNVDTYQAPYNRAKKLVKSINGDLFVLENEVRSTIKKMSTDIKTMDTKLNKLKETNKKLESKSSNMQGSEKGAEVRFVNSRQISYTELYRTAFIAIVGFYTFNKLRTMNN